MAGRTKCTLPIQVSEEVLEKNPKFSHLLDVLSTRLTSDGVTVKTKKKLDMAEKKVCLARQDWLMNQLPYYELRELITDLEVKSMEGNQTLEEEQLTEVLSQSVAFSELGDYLPLPSTSTSLSTQPTLMGLTMEDLDRHNTTQQHLPAIQRTVLPILEDRLVNRCRELYEFFTPKKDSATRTEKQEMLSLPSLVEEKKQQLSREKASLRLLKEKKKDNFLVYYQTLLKCLSSMQRLIGHHKLEVQASNDQIYVDWMEAWCEAICTRAKLMLLELDCDTYTTKTVAVLKVIRGHLDKMISVTERKLTATSQQLSAYRAVGPEFKTLVDHYTLLKKEIDDCSWGLSQFAQTD